MKPFSGLQPIDTNGPLPSIHGQSTRLLMSVREAADLGLGGIGAVIIFGGEQHPAEQQHGVDRRQFGGLEPVPGIHVDEVVEEARDAR